MEKIEIEMTVKVKISFSFFFFFAIPCQNTHKILVTQAGAEKMAKALSLASQKPDKPMEDIFKSLSNSTSRITLMMTALQKYQSMTLSDAGLIVDPKVASVSSESEQRLSNEDDGNIDSGESLGFFSISVSFSIFFFSISFSLCD